MLPQLRANMPVAGMLYFVKNFISKLFSIVLAGYHAGDVGMLSSGLFTPICESTIIAPIAFDNRCTLYDAPRPPMIMSGGG